MVQGTGSHVGKSLLVAGLCRIFRNKGMNVAPFKSQNMALNSYVTPDGKEIGRAQALQAAACKLEPDINMNPILLKPNGDGASQVMADGKFRGNVSYSDFYDKRSELWPYVENSFGELKKKHELIVIEGAGSPAEINLMDREIVNMSVARLAGAPVILVGDIDRGGVFASIIGTLELLSNEDRKRIKGFIINKFRGDKTLLKEATGYLEKKTGIPVLGIVDHIHDLQLDDEDSVSLEDQISSKPKDFSEGIIDIAVIKLPLISNYTDFEPLASEPDVNVRYVANARAIGRPDLIIIPGSKNVISDLMFLRDRGMVKMIINYAYSGGFVFGICGGYQMLGKTISDPSGIEVQPGTVANGLRLLEVDTELTNNKTLRTVTARPAKDTASFFGSVNYPVTGYEIHVGKTTLHSGDHLFEVCAEQEAAQYPDGALSRKMNVAGCYIHGLFDEPGFRRTFINKLRSCKDLAPLEIKGRKRADIIDDELDRLAALLEQQLDMAEISRIAGLEDLKTAIGPEVEVNC